jgi:hypothetical protein
MSGTPMNTVYSQVFEIYNIPGKNHNKKVAAATFYIYVSCFSRFLFLCALFESIFNHSFCF